MVIRGIFFVPVMVLLIVFCLLSIQQAESALSETEQVCLGCHGNKGLVLDLKNGEKLSLYIDGDLFSKSVHSPHGCSGCHTSFSTDKHPARILKNKREYAVTWSSACRACHIRFKSAIHNRFAETKNGNGKVCVDCHEPHSVKTSSRSTSKDSRYCLGCHTNEMSMTFKDGIKQSLKIDADLLSASVHSKLYCSDCHFGFSPDEHPVRTFKSKRDYTIAASESCRRCHFDKYTKTLESIHYTMLSQGNINAPVCVDCHGAHTISHIGKERTSSARRCQKCHDNIYQIYSKSVHGSALFNENNQDVPVCVDCHMAHNIEDPRTFDYREKIPQMCGNCHANKSLMSKYGLSTAVLKSYLQDFHGVTLKLYRKQHEVSEKVTLRPIAVCIDCHGIHDITATTDPKSSIVKANLVKRCRKCHPDATEDFPSSWISHYEPSLKRAPLVFLINLLYKIFIPFMMVGLILQILLHIWRYAVNR